MVKTESSIILRRSAHLLFSSCKALGQTRLLSSSQKPRERVCRSYHFSEGLIPYEKAWRWQQRLLHERMAWQREEPSREGHDVLLLLEHPSVYTLGRGSSQANLKFDPGEPTCEHEVRRTERGGEVTWHGPGQLVGYPIMDLNHHKKDLHWYLRRLEEVVIRVLAEYDLRGERDQEHTGVWVGGDKVAAIGLNASRWVTSHGFSINIAPDMKAFDRIVPCGIGDRGVGCINDLAGRKVVTTEVRQHIVKVFGDIFELDVSVDEVNVREGIEETVLFPLGYDQVLEERLSTEVRRQLEKVQQGRRKVSL